MCGWVANLGSSLSSTSNINDLQQWITKLDVASAAYAQQCYNNTVITQQYYNNTATTQQCSMFAQKRIQPSISENSTCPFPGKDRICLRDSSNIHLDTGLLDSLIHFGMNGALTDRFAFRNILECAPLRTDGYTEIHEDSDPSYSRSILYLYGNNDLRSSNISENTTYQFPANKTWADSDKNGLSHGEISLGQDYKIK